MSETGEKSHILIVDDNVTNIDILVNTLQKEYRLGVAKNGRKALDYALKYKPRLVLLDIMMPGMDGYEVCERLKQNRETRDIAVIFITAVHDIDSKTRCFELGGIDYVTKPFNAAEVRARVKTHISLMDYRDLLELKVRERTAQLEESNSRLNQMQVQIIQRLGKAAEYKDNETGEHVIRVSLYCGILAETLGLDRETVHMVRMCSPMHDLGKIGIPDRILLKGGPLDEEEWQVMRRHTMIGADILRPAKDGNKKRYSGNKMIEPYIMHLTDSRLLEISTRIAASHHEKWNGTGYPRRLEGDDIPIEARIVTVADVYDALSSKRPYKEAFSEEMCQEIIRSESGKALDPGIVEAFFSSLDQILTVKKDLSDEL